VTFGDGAKGEILGIGNMINNGLPRLDNVLLVKELTANLISIIQLCDQGLKVNFTKAESLVTDEKGNVIMRGVRSKDNCYLWVPRETTCLMTKEDEIKLWHQKHDSPVERMTDVEDDVGTSSKQTCVLDKDSNIESVGIDYEDYKANKVSSINSGESS
jgi:hypothetical protein